jgi:MFS family permease
MRDGEFTPTSIGAAVAAWMGFFVGPNTVLSSVAGLFMVPIAQTFGLKRATISAVLLLSPLTVTVVLPFGGRALDRWGLRRVLIPALTLFALLHMVLGSVRSTWQLIVVMFLLGITAGVHSSVGYAKLISQWFGSHRGVVLGVCVALGSGAGSALLPQLMRVMIRDHGWRGAYVILGAIILALGLPTMLWLLKEAPTSRQNRDETAPSTERSGLLASQALRTRSFWLLYAAVLLTSTALLGTMMHAYPMLTERGFSPQIATWSVSCMFIGTVIGQMSFGFVVDRIESPRTALPFFVCAFIGLLIVHSATDSGTLLAGSVLAGVGLGAENGLAAYLTSRYFGLLAFGSIFGWMFSAATLGAGLGLITMGAMHDIAGDYGPMRWIFAGFIAIAVVCIGRLGPYAFPSGRSRRA